MPSVAVFRHFPTEGPGYFADFLDRHGIDWRLIAIDAGDAVPDSAADFSGLVFMGGPMSVNDDLPWIPRVLNLIRDAVAHDIPVLGHCLGGQLMSKALGGTVCRNAVKEIGWGEVNVADNAVARAWFGEVGSFQSFHWHGETFTIPRGATHVLSSAHCVNQAFALGKHLGMQCHVEMTEEMVKAWCIGGADEIAVPGASVQDAQAMQQNLAARVAALNAVADRLYAHWVRGLVSQPALAQ
ncbi:MAG: type 1 glutamine amidotransferase [Pseudomonadota bacterium]